MSARALRVALAAGALIAGDADPARGQTLLEASLSVETVVSGFALPTGIAFLGPAEFLVIEKNTGRVRRVAGGAVTSDALDLSVDDLGERGLLGIARNTENPPRVFLYFSEAASDGAPAIANRVVRYTWNAALGRLESPALVLDLPVVPGPNHDGGIVLLGPPGQAPGVGDGALLYAVIGDLHRDGQLQNFAGGALPDDTSVILRVQQDGSPAPGNPLQPYCSNNPGTVCQGSEDCGAGSCSLGVGRYFAYGVRNSFGLALDPVTGSLWDTENGVFVYDEINRVVPGMNSGWERIMGPVARDPQGTADLFVIPGSTYRDPAFSFLDTIGVTSIVFPVGSSLGSTYDGRVLVGDNNTGQLYAIPLGTDRTAFDFSTLPALQDLVADTPAEAAPLVIGSGFGVITDLEVGPDGDLYVVSLSQGAVYRVRGPRPVPLLPLFTRGALVLLLAAALVTLRRARSGRERAGRSRVSSALQ